MPVAVFFAMTVTDGIAPPAGSVTIPVKLPMMSCATASPEHAQTNTPVQNKPNRISRFISDPFELDQETIVPYATLPFDFLEPRSAASSCNRAGTPERGWAGILQILCPLHRAPRPPSPGYSPSQERGQGLQSLQT